ncbi:DNA polymerase III subunit gamma/tau [Desulfovibrio inopinatus]|uniref:DNA polymerase III subunit gamma/tau n=1 Tax=Desulfovibrio inopinatus TaxID=102109 RepID=UPI000423163E|nr:DNA polymerase III subunit gamma/tau [Desulfovibrio inopinatus]
MSSASLTAKYRPQRFDEVAGQEEIKKILSRASLTDKIAPAYLFSGTRGVGKTTLARILAKSLNCTTAPTAEPCNECLHCRQITAGISSDVIEIDAATHGGVEEARRLKEDVGYAPLNSRYKVFIIDEAHMLSRAAFNALLKTLEEPPPRVTFIMATTEPHKFPATIISRCQHYIFKRMPQATLEAHLASILHKEGVEYDQSAVSILARRAAGSVRDGMSLLGQTLAVGSGALRADDVRDILGLAGQDVYFELMRGIADQDIASVLRVLHHVLDKGLDIGFFMRELSSCWRNMFVLSQAGEAAFDLVELTRDEAESWLEWAGRFNIGHIHACWQMTLEGQRRVMTSLEPALALELLLLNLTYLPRLLSLEELECAPSGASASPGTPVRPVAPTASPSDGKKNSNERRELTEPSQETHPYQPDLAPSQPEVASTAQSPQAPHSPPFESFSAPPVSDPSPEVVHPAATSPQPDAPKTWEGLVAFHDEQVKAGGESVRGIALASGEILQDNAGPVLRITCINQTHKGHVCAGGEAPALTTLARSYLGPDVRIEILAKENMTTEESSVFKATIMEQPLIQKAQEELGAQVIDIQTK